MDGHFWRGLLVLGGAALLFFVLYRLGMFSTSALVKALLKNCVGTDNYSDYE